MLARYAFPLHRHGRTTFVVLPSERSLALAISDFRRFDFPGVHPTGSFSEDLLRNHDGFAIERKRDIRVRRLGRPRALLHTASLVSQPPPPPPQLLVDESQKVLPGFNTKLIDTVKGARPLASGFHAALRHWAPFHNMLPTRVLAILQQGVRLEFNGLPPLPLWIQNHKLEMEHHTFVDNEVHALLQTGAIFFYDCQKLGPPVCILPLLVVQDASGELRLCWDARYLNSFLRKRRIHYESLDVLRLLLGPPSEDGSYILKVDLKAGYHHLLMAKGSEKYLAFEWQGQIYYWRALPFGVSSAPEAFEYVMQRGLRKLLRGPLQIPQMGYLDDTGAVIHNEQNSQLQLPDIVASTRLRRQEGLDVCPQPAQCPIVFLLCFMFFGASINVAKLAFGTCVEMLGILFDCVARKTFVPERRKAKLLPMLQQVVDSPVGSRVPVKVLAEIAGQLVSMYEALRFARQLLWAVFYAIYPYVISDQWHASTLIPRSVQDLCAWWIENFDECNGRDFFEPPRFNFEWDAAKPGAGSVLYGDGLILFGHVDRPPEEMAVHNDIWELIAAPELLLPMVDILSGHRLAMFGDNMFAISYLKRGGGSNPFATALVQRFFQWLLEHRIELVAVKHIPGALNLIADWLSRFQDFKADWALSEPAWCLFQDWRSGLGLPPPNFEAFASNLNHRLDRWCSRWVEPGAAAVDFFSYHGNPGDILWTNPPFGLLLKTLLQIAVLKMPAYLVIPHWSEQPWWQPAWMYAQSYMRLPPNSFTSIRLGHQSGYHDPGYPIYVLAINLPNAGAAGLSPPNLH